MTRDESMDQLAAWALSYHSTNAARRQWLAEVESQDGKDLADEFRARMARLYRRGAEIVVCVGETDLGMRAGRVGK